MKSIIHPLQEADSVKLNVSNLLNQKEMKNLIVFVLLLATAALFSCKKETIGDTGKGFATLTFRLTDAPAEYNKVNIDIIGAQAIIDDSIINLTVKAGIYNLLDFVNGKDTVIVDQQIPSGTLSQIRLILGNNNTIISGTMSHDLTTPSAQQSGLKLNVHADFLRGVAYEYIIDFDAARSIVTTGSGKYMLKPVLKVFTKAVSGAIQGVVFPAKAKPFIYAISSQLDTVSTISDTLSGKFMVRGLASGTYKLKFSPVSPYKDTTLLNIIVNTGLVTKLDTLKFK
jgi:hypothetical protein